ncbi:hypothetical protein SAMN05192529_11852 [Arachidicoccus rhizosphaerae]|uniref:NAD(P)-binding domain-containing protein n=1 Tax=Arachidicoccus rhizosphaerae TaxID=551991 RepID=A0A1H4B565_9BACT|nr:NAD(P)H-binding protein [Arachidicoccus rhizosphaerae]SEA43226.1 hypothetical protein SAMN05192529_11852 [Arachidicoccus rhizosphaerae]
MHVALIGASGFVGSHILAELVTRGHEVTAIARHLQNLPAPLKTHTLVHLHKADASREKELAPALEAEDAVISAFNGGWTNPDLYEAYMEGATNIEQSVAAAGIKRLIVIGGAGSLYDNSGHQLVDSPDFPKAFFAGASAARDYLHQLQKNTTLDWTFVSPAIEMNKTTAGVRRGHYRTGLDHPVFDTQGRSAISIEDLSMAIVDELEHPRFIRQRFTAAY